MICGSKEATSFLAPLNDIAGSKKKKVWKWTEIEEAAFDSAQAMLINRIPAINILRVRAVNFCFIY